LRSWLRSSVPPPRWGSNGVQLNSGLQYLTGLRTSNEVAVVIIVVVTGLLLVSATSGVERGIQLLANLGSFATIVLFAFFLVGGGRRCRWHAA
jgi:glycine betaine transporter